MIRLIIILCFLNSDFFYSQNINGVYTPIESKCKLDLKITKNNRFTFDTGKGKFTGLLSLSKEKNIIYIDFSDGIAGLYVNDTISIQNSGNSLNSYNHFKDCDEKFIHLVKKEHGSKKACRYHVKKNTRGI